MALPPRHRNYRAVSLDTIAHIQLCTRWFTKNPWYVVGGLQGTRAAINTPIQGSAADIVMLAMIALEDQPRLRELSTCRIFSTATLPGAYLVARAIRC